MNYVDKIFTKLKTFLPLTLLVLIVLNLIKSVSEMTTAFTINGFIVCLVTLIALTVAFIGSASGASKTLKRASYAIILIYVFSACTTNVKSIWATLPLVNSGSFWLATWAIFFFLRTIGIFVITILTIVDYAKEENRFDNTIKIIALPLALAFIIEFILGIIISASSGISWLMIITTLTDVSTLLAFIGIRPNFINVGE